jgi:hypothetical protein
LNTTLLKKPTGVFLIALVFILAPFGNLIISFAGSGVSNWYNFNVIIPFLRSVPGLDWLWLGLLLLTGILLLRPHKLTWSLAIVTLLLVLIINTYRLFNVDQNSIDPHFLKIFSGLAALCTLGLLVIAAYFRFPYLDRRTKWISSDPNEDRRNSLRTEIDRRDKT